MPASLEPELAMIIQQYKNVLRSLMGYQQYGLMTIPSH